MLKAGAWSFKDVEEYFYQLGKQLSLEIEEFDKQLSVEIEECAESMIHHILQNNI